jgi:hypothetical protein
MPPEFKHVKAIKVPGWTNYSGNVGPHDIPIYARIPGDADAPGALERHATAVREVLDYGFNQPQPQRVRTIGSKWSFSRVIEPGDVMIDPGNMDYIAGIPNTHWTPAYKARAAAGYRPIFVEGGTGIGTLNETLGKGGYALQTSGAGNGHRIAGCIATGTHGSALSIGALHDTVLAMYLIVSPDKAVFVQSESEPSFLPSVAGWIQDQTGIPTDFVADDDAIGAARVALGSIGFVFGVVVEVAPLYRFQIKRMKRDVDDPEVLHAIRTLDTSALHPGIAETPYHFDIVMHPYRPAGNRAWFATLMWKRDKGDAPFASPLQGIPRSTVDTMGFIQRLTDAFGQGGLVGEITKAVVSNNIWQQLSSDAEPAEDALFPGQIFGPTTLPRGQGSSTEIVVDHARALDALNTVFDVLHSNAEPSHGNFLLGCVAVRFVPKTRSLLGMNQAAMSCYIELPSIRSARVRELYRRIWKALRDKGIDFACHWGQLGDFTPEHVAAYYGENVDKWKKARRRLLQNDDRALKVFASEMLVPAGLD